MRHGLLLGICLLCLGGLVGCGDPYARAMKPVLRDMYELTQAYGVIKMPDHVSGATSKIQEIRDKLDADVGKLTAAEPSSETERQRLRERYAPVLKNMISKVKAEQARVGNMAGGEQAVSAGSLPANLLALAPDS